MYSKPIHTVSPRGGIFACILGNKFPGHYHQVPPGQHYGKLAG